MPDDHARRMNGQVRGIAVPADAWERVFGTPPEGEPVEKDPAPNTPPRD